MKEEIIIHPDGSKTVRLIFIPLKENKGVNIHGTNL